MSQENVDALRAIYDEWSRGNFRAVVDLYDRHVLLVTRADFPDADCYLGVDSIRTYMRGFFEPMSDVTFSPEEFIEADGSVVVPTLQRGTGRGSGAPTEGRHFLVWTFRGRWVIRLEFFAERAQALAAVGLSE